MAHATARITVSGAKTTIHYTNLGGSYRHHTSRSQYIMSQAPNVQMISGTTYTSEAFEQSLQSALLSSGRTIVAASNFHVR